MKKFLLVLLAVLMVFSMVACKDETPENPDNGKDPMEEINKKSEGVMNYGQYSVAANDSKVVIEAYVQAKQGWWEKDGVGLATIYTQDGDGAYFLYEMPCSKADYDKMVPGTKLKVEGYKSEWHGEVEIIDATYTILEGSYIATAKDVTALLGTDDLIKSQNMFVAFKGMTVVAKTDANGNQVPFFYNWDNSGEAGSDLYFDVSIGDKVYTFTVESYLCGKDTDVYKAVQALKVGDKIDMEGFLYWYDTVNPHITSVTKVAA